MSTAIEFVAFKLKKSVSEEEFFHVSDAFACNFLTKQKGYISRQVLCKGNLWADLVIWETEADHLNAMDASQTDPAAAAYISALNLSAKGSFYHLFTVKRSYNLGQ